MAERQFDYFYNFLIIFLIYNIFKILLIYNFHCLLITNIKI